MVSSMMDKNESAKLLAKVHIWVLVAEKLFKTLKTQFKNTELYGNINYSEVMKMFPAVVGYLKKYHESDDYISKLITINTNAENMVKRTIININYRPIDDDFVVLFTTSIANGILLSAEIATHKAFYHTEYDGHCTRINELYTATNAMTDKIESLYLGKFKIAECNKAFNNDVRAPIDNCIFGIGDMIEKIGLDIRNSTLYSPNVHQYTVEEIRTLLKERLHITDNDILDPEYTITSTGCLQVKAV